MNDMERKLQRLYNDFINKEKGSDEWNASFERACRYVEKKRLFNAWGAHKATLNEYELEIGRTALWSAFTSYDPTRGTSLSSWIITKIKYAYLQQREHDSSQRFSVHISKRAFNDWKRVNKKIDSWVCQNGDKPFDIVDDLGETKSAYNKFVSIDRFLNTHISDISECSPLDCEEAISPRLFMNSDGTLVLECDADGLDEDKITELMINLLAEMNNNNCEG